MRECLDENARVLRVFETHNSMGFSTSFTFPQSSSSNYTLGHGGNLVWQTSEYSS